MLLKNRFSNLDGMRAYFSELNTPGGISHVTGRTWMVTDFEWIRKVCHDPGAFRTYDFRERWDALSRTNPRKYDFGKVSESAAGWLLFMDGQEHLAAKKRLHQQLYQMDLGSVIERELETVLETLEGREVFDLMDDFSDPLITRIICSRAGLDPVDFALMREIERNLFMAFEPFITLEGIRKVEAADAEFLDLMKSRLEEGVDRQRGLVRRLYESYGREEMGMAFSILEFFFTAGIETSTYLLCESLLRLMTDLESHVPALLAKSDSDWIVEELIRLSSPAAIMARKVVNPVRLGDKDFSEGDLLLLSVASANRDPRYFPCPDTIHPNNLSRQHLAFGAGRHHCLGANLSRLELKIALPRFFERFSGVGLVPDLEGQSIREAYYMPGISHQPIRIQRLEAAMGPME
jgi:cytochrome P450